MTTLTKALVLFVTLSVGIVCGRAPIGGHSTDVGLGGTFTDVDRVSLENDIVSRWNAVADGRTSNINFHWGAFDQFPHPTFKFGTAEAYGEFAEVLAGFFERDDNFEFLADNELFEVRLRNVFHSGQIGIDTSFEELAIYFSSNPASAYIAVQTGARLQMFAERIRAAVR
jgi:hypothetical protein